MNSYTCNVFMGLLCSFAVAICLWLLPQAIFNLSRLFERRVCKCGQTVEKLDYYIIERYNAVLLLPRKLDINEELTGQPMVSLFSDATIETVPSDPTKPFCCLQPLEQAALLFELAGFTLKRHNIPCFIVPFEKGPLDLYRYSVFGRGSPKIDKFFLGEEEYIKTEYSRELEEFIVGIFKTFDGEENVIFTLTQLQKRKDLESD